MLEAINEGYVIQDARDLFYCGLQQYSKNLVDAQIYKRKKNALETANYNANIRKTLDLPFRIYKVTVNWTAIEETEEL